MEKVESLIVNRAGEFVPFSEGDKQLPITIRYLARVVEYMRFNRPLYIDVVQSKRDVATLRSMMVSVKKKVGVDVVTFKVVRNGREYLGFMKPAVNDFDVIE